MKTFCLFLLSITTLSAFAAEIVQSEGSEQRTAKTRLEPLTAREFLIPPDPRHPRAVSWPERLTLEDAPPLSVEEFKSLLRQTTWESVSACNGMPVSAEFLSKHNRPDYWNDGRFQWVFNEEEWIRHQAFPADPNRLSIPNASAKYRVFSIGSNIFELWNSQPYARDTIHVKRIIETGELVLVLPKTGGTCPDGSPIESIRVQLDPNVS